MARVAPVSTRKSLHRRCGHSPRYGAYPCWANRVFRFLGKRHVACPTSEVQCPSMGHYDERQREQPRAPRLARSRHPSTPGSASRRPQNVQQTSIGRHTSGLQPTQRCPTGLFDPKWTVGDRKVSVLRLTDVYQSKFAARPLLPKKQSAPLPHPIRERPSRDHEAQPRTAPTREPPPRTIKHNQREKCSRWNLRTCRRSSM